MTKEEKVDKILDELQEEFEKVNLPMMDKLTLFAKVQNAIHICVEPKTGHWIESHIPESVLVECSECGFSCGASSFNYCPMCGARMEVEE